jgi:DNA-binding SARP family transcriptional activator
MPLSDSAPTDCTAAPSRFHQQMDLQELRPILNNIVNDGDTRQAIERLKAWIIGNPLDENAFILLSEIYEQAGETNATVVALQRALQLKELSVSYQPSPSLLRFQEIESAALNDPTNPLSPGFDIQTNREGETRGACLQQHAEGKAPHE